MYINCDTFQKKESCIEFWFNFPESRDERTRGYFYSIRWESKLWVEEHHPEMLTTHLWVRPGHQPQPIRGQDAGRADQWEAEAGDEVLVNTPGEADTNYQDRGNKMSGDLCNTFGKLVIRH